MQYPVRSGPVTNDQAAFSPEMVQGVTSPRGRLPFSTQHPQPLSQTTHVQAAFSIDMVQGVNAARPSVARGLRHLPPVVVILDPAFTLEFAGAYSQPPRLARGPRIGLPDSQVTHVQAAFSPEMVQNVSASRPSFVRGLLHLQPVVVLLDEAFTLEFVGVRTDTPRLNRGPRIGLPDSQVTHIPAAFSVEMAAGYHPDAPRILLGSRIPLPFVDFSDLTAVINVDMFAGNYTGLPRVFRPNRFAGTASPPDVELQLLEFVGWQPDRPRLFLAPRLPQPISQPTHVAAPIGIEMFGDQVYPASPRLPRLAPGMPHFFGTVALETFIPIAATDDGAAFMGEVWGFSSDSMGGSAVGGS